MIKVNVVFFSIALPLLHVQIQAMRPNVIHITIPKEKSHLTLEELLAKAAVQYTILHHNTIVKKYDIKNIQSPSSPVPRSIADYILISAIVVALTHSHLVQSLSKLNYLAPHNRYKAELLLNKINQNLTQSIDLQGPWTIETDGYHNIEQGKRVYANLIYTLKHFDQLLDKTDNTFFLNQPLHSKLLWCSHIKMVSDPLLYPKFLELITTRTS